MIDEDSNHVGKDAEGEVEAIAEAGKPDPVRIDRRERIEELHHLSREDKIDDIEGNDTSQEERTLARACLLVLVSFCLDMSCRNLELRHGAYMGLASTGSRCLRGRACMRAINFGHPYPSLAQLSLCCHTIIPATHPIDLDADSQQPDTIGRANLGWLSDLWRDCGGAGVQSDFLPNLQNVVAHPHPLRYSSFSRR